ncbi:MAG TPA: TraR/DksA C4-type zinc finger protein [Miltoncostaeaceae bacterium]|jgi:DnaK suppressor protein|nr:TraR/DksA C4-type zinc finger protein [Miltoncostaeaceae bacterium]
MPEGAAPDEDPRARIARLEQELSRLLQGRDLAADGDERSDGHHHPAEAATDAEYREKLLRDRLQLTQQLERLRAAQAALEQGTYGVCVDCGESISPGRLRAVPDAVRCVPCQRVAARRR